MKKIMTVLLIAAIVSGFSSCLTGAAERTAVTDAKEITAATAKTEPYTESVSEDTSVPAAENAIIKYVTDEKSHPSQIMKEPSYYIDVIDGMNASDASLGYEAAVCLVKVTDIDTGSINGEEFTSPVITFEIERILKESSGENKEFLKESAVFRTVLPEIKWKKTAENEYTVSCGDWYIPVTVKEGLYLVCLYADDEYSKKEEYKATAPDNVKIMEIYSPALKYGGLDADYFKNIYNDCNIGTAKQARINPVIREYCKDILDIADGALEYIK